ncbi:MAG: DUF465 domain-containing protein [Pseudomonadota bacterium]
MASSDNDRPPDNQTDNEAENTGGGARLFDVIETPAPQLKENSEETGGANDEALLMRIALLEQDHSDMHKAIEALKAQQGADQLVLARLKKKKLQIKDEISKLREALTPDIIA